MLPAHGESVLTVVGWSSTSPVIPPDSIACQSPGSETPLALVEPYMDGTFAVLNENTSDGSPAAEPLLEVIRA